MSPDDRDRMLNRLIDSALAGQHVEPREGLEQRILANLRAQPALRPWWRWMWVPAVVAAALLLIAGLRVIRTSEPRSKPVIVEKAPPAVTTPQAPVMVAGRPAPHPAPRRVVATAATPSLPRQQTFPSPAPLSEEETMLLALLRRNRAEAVLVAQTQESERERIQKYIETGQAPEPKPEPAQPMR